jgi:hypothetical protein
LQTASQAEIVNKQTTHTQSLQHLLKIFLKLDGEIENCEAKFNPKNNNVKKDWLKSRVPEKKMNLSTQTNHKRVSEVVTM